MNNIHVIKGVDIKLKPSKRPGITTVQLLGPKKSPYQNIAIAHYKTGASVEMHQTNVPESIYILSGRFDLVLDLGTKKLEPGDTVYFPIGTSHGIDCKATGTCLLFFTPQP